MRAPLSAVPSIVCFFGLLLGGPTPARVRTRARRPEAKRRPTKSATTSLAGIQARLLPSATQLVRSDGRVR